MPFIYRVNAQTISIHEIDITPIQIVYFNFCRMEKTVAVVVLGDLGRSPRMRNHALSLAKAGFKVKMVGYGGSSLSKEITHHPNITIVKMAEPLIYTFVLRRYINYIIKCIWQTMTLWWCLLWKCSIPDYILLQNPPSIPALPVCCIFSYLFWWKTELVLDWHNYGYSIMALSFGTDSGEHPLVKFARYIEGKYYMI